MKIGAWFTGDLPAHETAAIARQAEAAGADSIWVAEGYYGRDAFVLLSAIAEATERVQLGPAVVNPFSRHPTVVAVATAALDELSGGRATIGIGSGPPEQLVDGLGYHAPRPLRAVAESVEIMTTLLREGRVDYAGEVFQARHVHLPFQPLRPEVPVLIAATGPKMCALAGELADAVYIASVDVNISRKWISDGAEKARKNPAAVEVPCSLSMSVAETTDIAQRRARTYIGMMLQAKGSEKVLEHKGLDGAIAGRIRDAVRVGGPRAAADLVPDEMLIDSVVGTPDECVADLRQRISDGMDYPVVSIKGRDAHLAIDVIAQLTKHEKGQV